MVVIQDVVFLGDIMDEDLHGIEAVFLDLDGTIYLGNELIPGALDFLSRCDTRGVKRFFLSNNSSRSVDQYVSKLLSLGIPVTSDDVLLSTHDLISWLVDNEISENAAKMGEYLGEGLRRIQSNNEFITEVRGMGLIWAVEFDSDMTPDVIAASNEAGLLMNPMRPNAVRLMPVLTITKEEIDEALARLETAMANASQ